MKNRLKQIIYESVRQALEEGLYDTTATPHVSKTDAQRELGHNPLRTDVGNHSPNDEVRQPSTFDKNGANFDGQHIVIPDNRFTFYKVKNFKTPDIKDTLSLFGKGASAEKELRRAIDTINGAVDRNGKQLYYRTITSETYKRISERTSYMSNTFWEFSFNGTDWYILKPQPIQDMKLSTFVIK